MNKEWDREADPASRTPVLYVSDRDKMQKVLSVIQRWRYVPVGSSPTADADAVSEIRKIVG